MPNDNKYARKIADSGFECVYDITNWKGINPFRELFLYYKLKKLIKKNTPDLICSFTVKPNIYVALAIRNTKINQIANITGLGYLFMKSKLIAKLFSKLYRYSFAKVDYTFIQNKDDLADLLSMKVFHPSKLIELVPGSGVDLNKFYYTGLTQAPITKFLFSGRLLYDKGLYELIEAIKIVQIKHPNIELTIIGDFYPNNPTAITKQTLEIWTKNIAIQYLGMLDDIIPVLSDAHCVILPSYREGIPRCLLEASSMGKPIITVDSVGCKEVVEHEKTGYLAKVKNIQSLANYIEKFITLPFTNKIQMGLNGRKKMEREFDQQIVINKYIAAIKQVLH